MNLGRLFKKISYEEWCLLIESVEEVNHRDALIAKALLHSGFTLREVLKLTIDKINFADNKIVYSSNRINSAFSTYATMVSYPKVFMDEIQDYINYMQGYRESANTRLVFGTSRGQILQHGRMHYVLEVASKKAGIRQVSVSELRGLSSLYPDHQNELFMGIPIHTDKEKPIMSFNSSEITLF